MINSVYKIRNRLQLNDKIELLVPNQLKPLKFKIEEMYDSETTEKIEFVNPGKEGQTVIIKIPSEAKKNWILRRKK